MSPARAPAFDLTSWLTEEQAAETLGCSPRSVRRMCVEGRGPQSAKRVVPGRKPERVYDPEDVKRIAARSGAVQPALIAVPAGQEVARVPAGNTPPAAGLALTGLAAVIAEVAEIIRTASPPQQPPICPWMTLDEASAYSGLSRTFLERLVKQGLLPHVRDRAIKVRRADVDTLTCPAMTLPDDSVRSGQKQALKRPDVSKPSKRAK